MAVAFVDYKCKSESKSVRRLQPMRYRTTLWDGKGQLHDDNSNPW